MTGTQAAQPTSEFVFQATALSDLADTERRLTLSAEDFALLNPNTRTSPIFSTRRDAELTKAIYRRVPVLIRDGDPDGNPWGIKLQQGLFNMTSDSHLFQIATEVGTDGAVLEGNMWRRGDETWLPLYEAKMVYQYEHRYGDYASISAGQRPHVFLMPPTCAL